MKFKTLNLPGQTANIAKTYDFLKFYKTAAEKSVNTNDNENSNKNSDAIPKMPKRRQSLNKMKKSKSENINVAKIDIDGQNLVTDSGRRSPLNESKAPTPNVSKIKTPCIKSIMKRTSITDSLHISNVARVKSKKRNKSVSFMLEDNEEVVIKKSKSGDTFVPTNQVTNKKKLKKNKIKNKLIVKEDKENNAKVHKTENKQIFENGKNKRKYLENQHKKLHTTSIETDHEMAGGDTNNISDDSSKISTDNIKGMNITTAEFNDMANQKPNDIKKKKRKRGKKHKTATTAEPENEITEDRTKLVKEIPTKSQKKKHATEHSESVEPVRKSKKKDKPEVIAKEIAKLNIGDNAHTLTNILNEMSVDNNKKNNKKKSKSKSSTQVKPEESAAKVKHQISAATIKPEQSGAKVKPQPSATEVKPERNTTEVKKTKKRKNKKKFNNLNAIVLVQNLPFSIILSYRKLLKEHFSKFGRIKSVGIADLKCKADDAKPIFATRIFFLTDEAAAAALTEDKVLFEHNIIRVKKYIAPALRAAKPSPSVTNSSSDTINATENEGQADQDNKIEQESDSD